MSFARTLHHAAPCLLLFAVLLPGHSAFAQPSGLGGPSGPAGLGMKAPHKTRVLESGEVDRYLKVLDRLIDLGLEFDSEPTGAVQEQLAAQRYIDTVSSEGFTPESFSEVHWNAMTAFAAAEMEKHRPELEQAAKQQEAQLRKMKAQLPPAQYEQMKRALGGISGMAALSPYQDVPPENRALVEEHRGQLQKIMEKGKRSSR